MFVSRVEGGKEGRGGERESKDREEKKKKSVAAA